jgi:DNA-binding response OmpR family regulator
MSQYLILSVGLDPSLMKTRTTLLANAGYSVLPSFTIRDAFQIFTSHDIDMVILCHTIPKEDKIQLIASIRERNKRTPVISLHADGEPKDEPVDRYVHSLDGPEAFLSCVAQVLAKSSGLQFAS